MSAIKILDNLYWVGVVDWNLRSFHGHTYVTKRGSTYNSYLIIGEKIALVDGVRGSFSAEFIDNIKQVVDPAKIDYVIANHVESDHSGSLPEIMKLCPKAKMFGTLLNAFGTKLFSTGDFGTIHSAEKYEVISTSDNASGTYKAFYFLGGKAVGGILLGDAMLTCPLIAAIENSCAGSASSSR